MKEHPIVRDLLSLAAAGILDPAEQRRVETHLHECESCRDELGGWIRLTGALKELPTPQAPPRLVLQTQRILAYASSCRSRQTSRVGLTILVLFSWVITYMTLKFVSLLNIPLAQWLNISSTTVWVTYIGMSWVATAFAVGALVKRRQQEAGIL
jgi:anti-sigma factor RsiW